MKPTFIGLVYNRVNQVLVNFRILSLRARGARIARGGNIGKIYCQWPHMLVIGKDCNIQDRVDFRMWHPYDETSLIKIGEKVFIGHGCEFVCKTTITIGDDCLIASHTTFNDTGHEYSKLYRINSQPVTSSAILIEEDVWIGTGCKILKGITIGRGAVVGAGSVVNKSIPAYEVWAGVPAKFIRFR